MLFLEPVMGVLAGTAIANVQAISYRVRSLDRHICPSRPIVVQQTPCRKKTVYNSAVAPTMQYTVQYPEFSLLFREYPRGVSAVDARSHRLPPAPWAPSVAPKLQHVSCHSGRDIKLSFGVGAGKYLHMKIVHSPLCPGLLVAKVHSRDGSIDSRRRCSQSSDQTGVRYGSLPAATRDSECDGWEVVVGDQCVVVLAGKLDPGAPELRWDQVPHHAHTAGYSGAADGAALSPRAREAAVEARRAAVAAVEARRAAAAAEARRAAAAAVEARHAAVAEADEMELEMLYGGGRAGADGAVSELERVNALLVERVRTELRAKREMENELQTVKMQLREDTRRATGMCCVCLENPADHAALPCGHVCLCGVCASEFGPACQFKLCPLCKRGITAPTCKVFMSEPLPVRQDNIVAFL